MDVYIQSEIGVCSEFEPRRKEPISIVISPIRVEGAESRLKIVSGCNMWHACTNVNCFFSGGARKQEKIKVKG